MGDELVMVMIVIVQALMLGFQLGILWMLNKKVKK